MDPTKVVGRRVAAFIFDLVLTSAINTAVFFALAKDPVEGLRDGDLELTSTIYGNVEIGDSTYSVYGGTAAAYFLFSLALGIVYWVVLPGIKGWTPGKLLTGIRVQKEDGSGAPGIGRSFGRQFMWIADGFPYIIPYLVGFVTAASSDRHQRLGDRVASTVVVSKEAFGTAFVKGGPVGGSAAAPPPLAKEFQPSGSNPPNWPS